MLKLYTTLMMYALCAPHSLMAMSDGDIDALLSEKSTLMNTTTPVEISGEDMSESEIDVDDMDMDGNDGESEGSDDASSQHTSQATMSSPSTPSTTSGYGASPQVSHGASTHGDDATWKKNAKAFGDQSIKTRISRLQKMIDKQSATKTATLTVDGTQKKITDLTTHLTTEKDPKKVKRMNMKMQLLQFQLAVLTGACPPEFHVKTGAQDPKNPTASYDEKAWKKLVSFVQHYDLKKFIQKASKMTPEARYLMQSVWEGNYPETLKSKKQSTTQSDHVSPGAHHGSAPQSHGTGGGHGSGSHGPSTAHTGANDHASTATIK